VFLAGRESVDLNALIPPVQEYTERFDRSSSPALFEILDRKEHCTLLENLWRFQDKQCFDPRDRVYSLLSISQVDAGIVVDYSQSIAKLAMTVLQSLKDEFRLCTAKMVLQTLGVEGSSFANELLTMVERHISPPSWGESPGKCPHCTESVIHNYVFKNVFRSHKTHLLRQLCP
jgi:hypothetical protein